MGNENEPQEYRDLEKRADTEAASVAANMLRYPRMRWILMPLHRLFKWISRQADAQLKEDGWR